MALSNPDKILWPKEKYTKQDVLEYYKAVAPFILPYLKNRPIVLRRFPDGIEGENFVQKSTQGLHLPKEVQSVEVKHTDKTIHYLMIQNEFSLEYAVNLAAIELHPFHSQVGQLDYPDYFVLDLDPESVSFDQVVKTALEIHHLLDQWQIPNFCKTSGGRGLHIFIPMHAKYTSEQVSRFGAALGLLLHQELPQITSLERNPHKRQKKIYLDVLQNRLRQTIVAAYSLRGKIGAPVSTPLHWDELKEGVTPLDFTLKTVPSRLKKMGDIFTPVLGKGFDLRKWANQYR